MKVSCPLCKQPVGLDDVNIAKDTAFCRRCNQLFSLSDLVNTESLFQGVDLSHPPPGAWYCHDGVTTVAGATNRSLGGAIAILAFALFWNGIVSIFVSAAIAGTMQQFHMAVPAWFPAPRMNGPGFGSIWFLWLFLTPFMAVGILMLAMFLFTAFGHSEFTVSQNEATLFSGVGPIGRRRQFRAEEVASVRIDSRTNMNRNSYQVRNVIVVEARSGQIWEFGGSLAPERQRFVAAAMAAALLH